MSIKLLKLHEISDRFSSYFVSELKINELFADRTQKSELKTISNSLGIKLKFSTLNTTNPYKDLLEYVEHHANNVVIFEINYVAASITSTPCNQITFFLLLF